MHNLLQAHQKFSLRRRVPLKEGWSLIRGPFPWKQEGNGVGKGCFKKRGGLGFISMETGRKWCQKKWFQKRGSLGFIFIKTKRKWCEIMWFPKRGGLGFISIETGRKWCHKRWVPKGWSFINDSTIVSRLALPCNRNLHVWSASTFRM